MSLKAGRVGVNPADVDPVSGNINPSSVDSYTKSQADDKFLSKSDAASTYESKSDASTAHNQLQPKTLIVPISMLQGSQLVPKTTVESVFATMDGAMTNEKLTDMVSLVSGELRLSWPTRSRAAGLHRPSAAPMAAPPNSSSREA